MPFLGVRHVSCHSVGKRVDVGIQVLRNANGNDHGALRAYGEDYS